MNRKNKRFAVAPSSVNMRRSKFDMPYTHLTTGNFGKIIPFYVNEVLPGDTFSVNTSILVRMSTPVHPVMDDAWLDYYYFFVPNRLVWSHWAEFLGENKLSAWVQTEDYILPNAEVIPEPGSVFDHMGLPTYSSDDKAEEAGLRSRPKISTHVLPLRMYNLIYNEWFRNQNTTDPVLVNTGDDVTAQEIESFQKLRNAAKPFDYFTTALPSPQKGDAVDIPLAGDAPVIFGDRHNVLQNSSTLNMTVKNAGFFQTPELYPLMVSPNQMGSNLGTIGANSDSMIVNTDYQANVLIDNAWADLSSVSSTSINFLRQAFQMQRLLELQARTGTRYTEIIKASFGVTSPDARLQRPEFLGGKSVKINISQVNQTSSTDAESPLGHVGAFSKTASAAHDFVYSFTEHGYVIGVMVARHALTYQQGVQPHWSRRSRYNFYWPTFAHIGEQPIPLKAIYATGLTGPGINPDIDENRTFGFGEAWAEYRTKPNECTGAFRSTVDTNLDEWHYADYYTSGPYLSEGWMNATGVNVDRTLYVTSDLHDQLIFDIRVDLNAARVMPLYSIPGLVDHF